MHNLKLNHFKPSEFGNWWGLMDESLLIALDDFREYWGAPVLVSKAAGAIGRKLAPSDTSMHNINLWGKVMAIDFFPKGMDSPEDMKRALDCAEKAGFTGVGLYTDTKPSFMMHGDVRPTRSAHQPASWSRIDGKYLAIEEALKC